MGHNVNIKYVAERAKVSISTVSRVLNNSANVSDALKERVHRAIEETQFQVNPIASSLKSARRNQVAIVIPSLRQILYTDIIKGFSDFCYQRQVTPVILETSGDPVKERRLIQELEKQWVDGIVYIPSHSAKTPEAEAFFASLSQLKKQDNAIPVVLAECDGAGLELDCVRLDYENAFYKMAYHLLEIGRRHMAYLSGSKDSPLHEMCLSAVNRALGDFGCQLEENLMEYAGYTILTGYHAMERVLARSDTVDSVLCANDQVAAGALFACKEQGVYDQRRISFVGFGGVSMSIITSPSITTVVAPRYELGWEAASVLFQRLSDDSQPPREVVLPSHLAIRESTLRTATKRLDTMFAE